MLEQRRRRWADVVQMLYKCFVFAGMSLFISGFLDFFKADKSPNESVNYRD